MTDRKHVAAGVMLDAFTRLQVLVERVKLSETKKNAQLADQMAATVRRLMATLSSPGMGMLSRTKLTSFVAVMRAELVKLLGEYQSVSIVSLHSFYKADRQLIIQLMQELTGLSLVDAINSGSPVYADATTLNPDTLWAYLLKQPMSSGGNTLSQWFSTFAAMSANRVLNLVSQGWSNNWTVQQTLDKIVGTQASAFKDGALNTVRNTQPSVSDTAIQFAHGMSTLALTSAFFDKYGWFSILDSRTSETCQELNGQIFVYGDGPIPPAHPRCRSHIAPVDGDSAPTAPTYSDWLASQPQAFKDEADLSTPLSVSDLLSKLSLLTQGD